MGVQRCAFLVNFVVNQMQSEEHALKNPFLESGRFCPGEFACNSEGCHQMAVVFCNGSMLRPPLPFFSIEAIAGDTVLYHKNVSITDNYFR